MKKKVLIVDDESEIRSILKVILSAHQHDVYEADSAHACFTEVVQVRPDIILLDLGLPDLDGISVLQQLRTWYHNPILILSARDDEESIVTALDLGADDYLTKPFNTPELLARIRVSLRHKNLEEKSASSLRTGDLEINFATRRVTRESQEIKLTVIEFNLLKLLFENLGRVVTHSNILKTIWGPNSVEQRHYLRIYIGHLRQKIEKDPNQPSFVVTEPGVGYRLSVFE